MRIIHTADWHIGRTLAGHVRDHEHRAVLAEVVSIVARCEADALVIAGDVFDHQNPSGEAQRLFYETLVALKQVRPQLQIVVTSGNHDSAGRLEAPRQLLEAMGVHVVGNVRRVAGGIDAMRHLVPLTDRRGEVAANVLAVSYPTAACLPPFGGIEIPDGASPIAAATRALYAELMEGTRRAQAGLPLIVTGHLHVAGGIESEGAERRILVGGQHAVSPDVFPPEAAYVALGHLHKAQGIGRETIRYSGSLLPLSATELSYAHGVTLLTLGNAGIEVGHLPLQRPVPFLRLPEHGDARLDELGDRLKALELPDMAVELRPFVQVRLAREGLGAGFRAELDRIADGFPVRVVETRVAPASIEPADPDSGETFRRLAELEPADLFRQAFERAHGAAPSPAHEEAFHMAAAAAAAEA